nr:MMPL family transporter [Thermoleophilaceae bacterium]
MQAAMDRLDGFLKRHPRAIIAAWVVLLLAAAPFALRQTEHLTSGGFSAPGSGSKAVNDAADDFENAQAERLAVVIARRPGASAADMRAEIDRADRIAAELPHVELTGAEAARAKAAAAEGRPVAIATLQVKGSADQVSDLAVDLREELEVGQGPRSSGVEPYLVGQQALWAGMQDLSKEDLAAAETTGFPIVLLILLAVFGSLAAAALPLALGFGSVVLTGAAIFFLSQATDMSVFVTNVASMIGIGVAVDYSLFILARYREEIRAGAEPDAARQTALRTSGLAVVFSGVTVMVALAGLFLVDSTTIRSMAMGAIIVVAISILGALTLLPVLMRVLGHRTYARGKIAVVLGLVARTWRNLPRRRGSTSPDRPPRTGFWERWTDRVMRRPVLAVILSGGLLLTLAIPAVSLQFGDGALRQFPEGNETRVGAELAAKQTGAGAAGPTQVLVEFERGTAAAPENLALLRGYRAALADDPEVARVAPPLASKDSRAVLVATTPRHDPESPEARALVDRLREGAGAEPAFARATDVSVGGSTAQVEDFKDLVSGSMWKILLFVAVLSYLVLFVLLRSLLLPLKAVLMNLLSVGAAYGVLVAIFQWGWIDGFLGFQSLGYINTMTPPFLLAIVFGLSMDYEVFLLSRIRERFGVHGDTSLAVAEGVASSARLI